MSDVILWARLDDPCPAVNALPWPDRAYMYLERVPAGWLSEAERENGLRLERFKSQTQFDEWERGRVFCAKFELLWEKLEGGFQVVYVGQPVALAGLAAATEIDLGQADRQSRSCFLWGNRVSDAQREAAGMQCETDQQLFFEFEVPRLLSYPVSAHSQHAKLQICEYLDSATGERLYYRFQGLEGIA